MFQALIGQTIDRESRDEFLRLLDWKVRSISSPQDLLVSVGRDVLALYTNSSRQGLNQHGSGNEIPNQVCSFWTSPTAVSVYVIVGLTVLTNQLWLLHGLSVLAAARIAEISLSWLFYIVDDSELQYCYSYLGGWVRLALREGEKTLTGKAGWRYAAAYSAVGNAPLGISALQWYVRHKMKTLRYQFLHEIGFNRFHPPLSKIMNMKNSEERKSHIVHEDDCSFAMMSNCSSDIVVVDVKHDQIEAWQS